MLKNKNHEKILTPEKAFGNDALNCLGLTVAVVVGVVKVFNSIVELKDSWKK